MNVRIRLCRTVALFGLAVLSACHQQSGPRKQVHLYRLFDLFQPEDLKDPVTPENAGWKRVEWQVQDMTPLPAPSKSENEDSPPTATPLSAIGFEAFHDLTGVRTNQGQLVGESTGAAPMLHLALRENRGGAASVKVIEMRMRVSQAKQIWLRTESGPSIDAEGMTKWASQTNSWKISADVAEDKLQTYRFELSPDRGPGGRGGRGGGGRGGPPDPGGPPGGGGPPGPPGAPGATNPPALPGTNAVANSPGRAGRGGPAGADAPDAPGAPGGRGGGPPPGMGGPRPDPQTQTPAAFRHLLLTFRDAPSAKFALESIRFLSDKEEKLKDASGQQWAGLADIYRATLAAKSSEAIRIPLRELPEHAWLDFAFGTKEDAPVKFKVAIASREGKEYVPKTIFERTVTIPNRWQMAKIDLSAWSQKSILLEFTLSGGKKGLWGYWGNPIVRLHPDLATSPPVLGDSAAGRKPRGVILILIDTLRKDHLNIYGYPRETVVHLKKFAEEGVTFEHAISQGTMTKISVPSIMTSLYPLSHTVLGFDKGLPASAKTLAEVFREQGYATVAYSAVTFTGKGNNMHQGYDELHEAESISDSDYHNKTARPYVDRLIPWLEDHKDMPFFVFLHVFDPHSPFRPRPPYDTIWGDPGAKDRLTEIEADMRKHDVRTGMDNLPAKEDYVKTGNKPEELLKIYTDWYDGAIRGADAEIGRLLEALREMGLDQDTLMVWATDHGEELWDHGKFFHGHSVYGELNQVPLVFHWPNNPEVRPGARVNQQIENIDIMPTILALVGLQGPTNMQGQSLVPLLNGKGISTWQERPALTHAMVGDGPPGRGGGGPDRKPERPHFGIIDHGWKLVRKELESEVQEEIYEHPVDSLNLTNVIKSEGSSAHVKLLAEALDAWKTRATEAKLPSDDTMTAELSPEELRRLRALGYLGGTSPPRPAETNTAKPMTNAVGTTNSTLPQKDAGHLPGHQPEN